MIPITAFTTAIISPHSCFHYHWGFPRSRLHCCWYSPLGCLHCCYYSLRDCLLLLLFAPEPLALLAIICSGLLVLLLFLFQGLLRCCLHLTLLWLRWFLGRFRFFCPVIKCTPIPSNVNIESAELSCIDLAVNTAAYDTSHNNHNRSSSPPFHFLFNRFSHIFTLQLPSSYFSIASRFNQFPAAFHIFTL